MWQGFHVKDGEVVISASCSSIQCHGNSYIQLHRRLTYLITIIVLFGYDWKLTKTNKIYVFMYGVCYVDKWEQKHKICFIVILSMNIYH